MADVIKCATRDAYGAALKELGNRDDILVLDADLAKATKTITFKKEFPDKSCKSGAKSHKSRPKSGNRSACWENAH